MYVPSLHILYSKLKKFLTTYPTLSANVICESYLISLAIICFDQEWFHSFIDVSHSNFVETEIPTKRQCTNNRQKNQIPIRCCWKYQNWNLRCQPHSSCTHNSSLVVEELIGSVRIWSPCAVVSRTQWDEIISIKAWL